MAKEPTEKQVKKEIETLKKMLEKVRPRDAFGGDNQEKIQAQIDTLEDEWDEDEIYERFPDEEEMDIRSNALDAYNWMSGNEKMAPSVGWKPLCK